LAAQKHFYACAPCREIARKAAQEDMSRLSRAQQEESKIKSLAVHAFDLVAGDPET